MAEARDRLRQARESPTAEHTGLALTDLLDLALLLPFDAGARAVARAAVDRLHAWLPHLAVGTCIAEIHGGDQIVEYRLPSEPDAELGRDPTRLFPRARFERVIALDDGSDGSTLHVAGDDPALESSANPLAHALERAAQVIATAVRRSNTYDRMRESGGDVERLRGQLIQAEKLASLGQVVAGVVHELNNPLTSIVAYSDFLLKKAARGTDDPDDVERLRRIGEAAERILLFTRDLMAYARPSHDVPGAVVVHEVIDKALVFCEHELASNRVDVHRDFVDSPPPVRGVGGQLTQVFVNLFTNASHAMAATGGMLRISTRVETDMEVMVVEVTDNGVGIPRAVLDHVFDPFFSTKPEGKGTGLGLSIAKDIVSAHGGTLTVRSSLGEGTTFDVTLRLAARPPSSGPAGR